MARTNSAYHFNAFTIFLKFILFRRALGAELKAGTPEGLHLKSRNEESQKKPFQMECIVEKVIKM